MYLHLETFMESLLICNHSSILLSSLLSNMLLSGGWSNVSNTLSVLNRVVSSAYEVNLNMSLAFEKSLI